MEENASSRRDPVFDIARAISILYIVGYWHLYNYSLTPMNAGLKEISYGFTIASLSTFCYMSGLFLGRHTITGMKDAVFFYKKRIMRFWLLYALAVMTMFVIGTMAGDSWAGGGRNLSHL